MYQTLRNTLIYLLAIFVLVDNSFADNWHRWRGPNNDGISQATEAPLHWSQTENVRWRLPLPGEAASTPVVWEDKIFLTSADGNTLVLMCISTEGEELWKRTIAHGNQVVRRGEGNSAAPSPTTDGEHVWAFFGTGDLVCYDFQCGVAHQYCGALRQVQPLFCHGKHTTPRQRQALHAPDPQQRLACTCARQNDR